MNERDAVRSRWIKALVLLAYAGVAVGTTWPLVSRMTTHLPGHTRDTFVHYWNGWWVRQALKDAQSPYYTTYLFHPEGISLVFHNFAWLNIAGWLLLDPLVGGFAAYNLCFLLNLALCGWAAFLLVRELTGDWRVAFLAGLIYQCWPFRMAQLDHPNLISTQWIPLFLLFLIRTLRRGRWQDGLLTGVFFTLVGYTRWQLLIPAAIVGVIYFTWHVLERWISNHSSDELKPMCWMPALALAGCVAALALAPPALLLIDQQQETSADLLVEEEEATMQTDLLAYLTPGASHPVMGSVGRSAYSRYYGDRSESRRFPAYVGVSALILGLVGIWKERRESLPWLMMAVAFILLALGKDLSVNGRHYPAVPMPYRLASKLFVIRLLRFPDRFNLFLALPMATLAAHGAASVVASLGRWRRWGGAVALGLLGVAVLSEYLMVPAPLRHVDRSSFYARLDEEPGDFAVFNLPVDSQKSKRYMFAQVVHQRPILQGKTARWPEGTYAYLDGHPWLRVLRELNEMDPRLTDVSRQLGSLAEDGVRYLILHKNLVGSDRLAHWRRYLPTEPRFEDEQIVAYATEPRAGHDFSLSEELAPGLGPIRVITSTDCVWPGRALEVDVAWGTTRAIERDYRARLALVAEDGVVQAEDFSLSPGTVLDETMARWPSGAWPADAVAWGYYVLNVDPALAAGTYTATLALADAKTGTVEEHMTVGEVRVSTSPCDFVAPSGSEGVNAVFGDELRLLGYRLRRERRRVDVTLYWRSERRMATDYKIFVHVFDPATGVPGAQRDAMPHWWAYPTSFWGPGEEVKDLMPVSLQGVSPGEYGVAIGVYDPETMERLPVVDEGGQTYPDGRLLLVGEIIEVKE